MLNKKLCRQISTSPEAAVIPVAPVPGLSPRSPCYFRVAVYLETSAPRLAFLERSIFVASAVRRGGQRVVHRLRVTWRGLAVPGCTSYDDYTRNTRKRVAEAGGGSGGVRARPADVRERGPHPARRGADRLGRTAAVRRRPGDRAGG